MPTAQEMQIWKDRFDALNTILEQLDMSYSSPQLQLSRKLTFDRLIKSLKTFAGGQFGFFYHGFQNPPPAHRLLPSPKITFEVGNDKLGSVRNPVNFIFDVIIDQVEFDLEVIQRAASQRMCGTDAMRRTLETADNLAWSALQPFINNLVPSKLVNEQATVITYFGKSANIRVIPYAPVALIAVPFTTIDSNTTQDFLAIGHEVGHYVYWHGVDQNDMPIHTRFDQLDLGSSWADNWKEEIFADVYGCLIAGPVIGRDFQDLLLREPPIRFVKDDKDHPVSVLRPDIYAKVLHKKGLETQKSWGQAWSDIANMLTTDWDARRRKHLDWDNRPVKDPNTVNAGNFPRFETVNNNFSVTDALSEGVGIVIAKPVDKAIEEAYNILTSIESNWSGTSQELASIQNRQDLNNLYDYFQSFLIQLSSSGDVPPDLAPPDDYEIVANAVGISPIWRNWVKQAVVLGKEPVGDIDGKDWELILDAGGWATKGPKSHD